MVCVNWCPLIKCFTGEVIKFTRKNVPIKDNLKKMIEKQTLFLYLSVKSPYIYFYLFSQFRVGVRENDESSISQT